MKYITHVHLFTGVFFLLISFSSVVLAGNKARDDAMQTVELESVRFFEALIPPKLTYYHMIKLQHECYYYSKVEIADDMIFQEAL